MKKSELYKLIQEIVKEQQNLIKPGIEPNTNILDKEIGKDDENVSASSVLNCDSTKSYGSVRIYHNSDCDEYSDTDDSFICCSSNNNSQNTTPSGTLFSITHPTQYATINVGGGQPQGCYCPSGDLSDCLGEGSTQHTIRDVEIFYYYYGGGGGADTVYCGGTIDNPSDNCNFDIYQIGDAEYTGCSSVIGGCPHPLSTLASDGEGLYIDDSEGCLDPSGVPYATFPENVSCCRFTGCGSVTGNVSANNIGLYINGEYVSEIPEQTGTSVGTIPAMEANDGSVYWVDDQSCNFDQWCTAETVTLNGIDYATNNNQNYQNGVVGSNYYDGTSLSGGTCTVLACGDTNLQDLYANETVMGTAYPVTTTFAIAAGTYSDYNVVVENDVTQCDLQVCLTPGFDTYCNPLDSTNWCSFLPLQNTEDDDETNDASLYTLLEGGECVDATIYGCTDQEACNTCTNGCNADDGSCEYAEDGFDCAGNVIDIVGCTNSLSNPPGGLPVEAVYNSEANADNGLCQFHYCTDSEASNYVCITEPTLCLNTDGISECTSSCPNGTPLTDIGTFYSSDNLCNYPVVGCTDPNSNTYNEDNPADTPCTTGCLPENALEPVSSTNPVQTGANCCCTYNLGCNDPNACNYNQAVTIDDGSCIPKIEGCMQPGMTNYDPSANFDDGSCYYEGCVDDGISNQIGTATTSPWQNYVCREGSINFPSNPVQDLSRNCYDNQPTRPNTYQQSLRVGEWLCQCGNHPLSGGMPCTGDSQFNVSYGEYIDGTLGTYSTPDEGIDDDLYDFPGGVYGDCEGVMENAGCYGDGSGFWMQNDGTGPVQVAQEGYDPLAVNDGSCTYAACANAFATNYFCVDNPGLCTTNIANFASGCSTDPMDYPDGQPTCLDGSIGTLNLPIFLPYTAGCIFDQSYKCEKTRPEPGISGPDGGCVEVFDGTGKYSTLGACKNKCRWCSTTHATQCGGSWSYTFDCLFLDGLQGNETGTSPWGAGQDFEADTVGAFAPPPQGGPGSEIYYGDGGMPFQYASGQGPKPIKGGNTTTRRMTVVSLVNQWLDSAVPENFQYPWQAEQGLFDLTLTYGTEKKCPNYDDDRPIRPDDEILHDWCGTDWYGSYGWGPGCFIPNTLITMADSTEKTISSVEIGDKVKSEIGESKVIGIDIHKGEFEVYSINDSKHFITADHPLKTTEGWKSIDPTETFKKHRINSEVLKVGDVILKIDGEEEVISIKGEEIASKVYNLKLDNEHVYYADGYLVHNDKGGIGENKNNKQMLLGQQPSITCCSEFGPQNFPLNLEDYQNEVCRGDKLDKGLNADYCQQQGLTGPPCASRKTIQEEKLRKLIRKTFKKLDNK